MNDEIEQVKLEFPCGLLGFENYKHFSLVKSEYNPFYWMNSEDNNQISFLVADPFIFFSDYEVDVDDETLAKIGIKNPEEVVVLTIITIPGNGKNLTANLQGPLVINKNTKTAIQAILADAKWTTKHEILPGSLKGD